MNPLKRARLDRNLTQRQLASLSGLTVNAIIKYEQGLYNNASEKILNALCRDEITWGYLWNAYHSWQHELRKNADLPYTKNQYSGYSRPVGTHPFEHYRTNSLGFVSRLAFCKALALHPSIVAEYEAGRTREAPVSIVDALILSGVEKRIVTLLDSLGIDFYNARLHEPSS